MEISSTTVHAMAEDTLGSLWCASSSRHMVLRIPFKRWIYDETTCYKEKHGGNFYLIPVHGKRVVAALSLRLPSGGVSYKVHRTFKRDYGHALNLREPWNWDTYDELVIWLNAQVHNSFMHSSAPGVERCWFFKPLWAHDIEGSMAVPTGYQPYFTSASGSIWVLLRNGSKCWPIRVVEGNFEKGWRLFRKAHKLKAGQKLIFGCERQWIFDVTILDNEEKEVMYHWTLLRNPLWQNPHQTQGRSWTSCPPSLIHDDYYLTKNGICCMPKTNYYQAFQRILDPFLVEPDAASMSITMGNRNWVVLFDDNHRMHGAMFYDFLESLKLKPFQYVFVIVLALFRLRVIVFDRTTGSEEMWNWYASDV